ncbi:MAG: hypothetical protein Q9168_006824 [Polycauliona sp. 1 TL-2023]
MADKAADTTESTAQTSQPALARNDDPTVVKTESGARSRSEPPARSSSASDESLQSTAPFQQQPRLDDETQPEGQQAGSFGVPTPLEHNAGNPDSPDPINDTAPSTSGHSTPGPRDKGKGKEREIASPSPPQDQSIPGHDRTVRFADVPDGLSTSGPMLLDASSLQDIEQGLAAIAAHRAQGSGGLPTTDSNSGELQDVPDLSSEDDETSKTLIYGHKAGLWLSGHKFKPFCRIADRLLRMQWDDLGELPKIDGVGSLEYLDFNVRIKDGNKLLKLCKIKAFTKNGKEQYEKYIRPFLLRGEPKPHIQVRHDLNGKWKCGCEDKKEESCDNSMYLEVFAPNRGFAHTREKWHLWREPHKLEENSLIFDNGIMEYLYPSYDSADIFWREYEITFPDDTVLRFSRDKHPFLTAEIQEALSRFTTAESNPGAKSQRIELRMLPGVTLEKPPASPNQRSPGELNFARIGELLLS